MSLQRPASQVGLTLVELAIVVTIIGILLTIPITSYLHFRDRANSAAAKADVREIVPSIEAYFADRGTYAGMTLPVLQAAYDRDIDPARYTLASVTPTGYCIASSEGGISWKKNGPAAPYVQGSCP